MNELARIIAGTIEAEGPIPVERYWNMALFDTRHGYYANRMPFGRGGDFTTAPEISQMFGELLGAWIVAAWRELGRPAPFVLAEIGPGRGTLMSDMLRTIRGLDQSCLKASLVRLVETSDALAALQMRTLERFDLPLRRVRRVEELEAEPLIVLANELFDAIAIRQFVFDGSAWRERCITASRSGRFSFVLCRGMQEPPLSRFLSGLHAPAAGAVLEISPARETMAAMVGDAIRRHGGAGLFIDYGHWRTAYGDTLQAVREHAFADPLDGPGECDLTSHVDFARLRLVFRERGLAVGPDMEQGRFLLSLGLAERAGTLGRARSHEEQDAIRAAAQRLAGGGKAEMGNLFNVLAVASRTLDLAPFQNETA